MALRALKLTLEYDGSAFNGYQSNPGARCVQDVLENGIDKLTGEKRRTLFASRTDAGVHARGQVALVRTSSQLECSMFMRNLNTRWPSLGFSVPCRGESFSDCFL
jgi:tRNA pseudouridine38-40 synthase